MTSPAHYLQWDSDFFERRIARVSGSTLDEESATNILTWCEAEQVDCVYLLAEADHARTVQLAEAHEFGFMDIRLTLERKAPWRSKPSNSIRPFVASDIPALKAIASISHRDTRFYYDPHFPDERCDQLYETWIENSCKGFADQVLVAVHEDQPVGYITCHLHESTGDIGLIAVSTSAQGRGYGTQLIEAALDWFAQQRVTSVSVVTQGRNVPAQRLYQKCGFLTKSLQLWYHRWF